MKYYTPGMFEPDNIETLLKPLFMQKETWEFQLGIYQEKFDTYKKVNFPEMLIFERKKEQDPSLIPDKHILQQFKEIEKEPAVVSFRKTITKLKRDIRNIEQEIANETKRLNSMFSFKDKNYEIYVEYLNRYYLGKCTFTDLMEIVFTNEFNDKRIYYEVAGLRNMPILNLLVQKSPLKFRDIMRNMYEEAQSFYKIEEVKLIVEFDLMEDQKIDVFKLSSLVRVKYAKLLGEQQ